MVVGGREPIRVLVLEDHPIVGQGVAEALAASDGFGSVGIATSLADVSTLRSNWTAESRPDVVVADIDLDGELAFDLPRRLGPGGPAVLFLSGLDGPAVLRAAIESGAVGFVHKRESRDAVVRAVRRVADGDTAFSIDDVRLARSAHREPSDREREVLAGLTRGKANKEIASDLGIEERGIEAHVRRLLDRYGCSNRTELAVLALREGWLRGHA